MSASPGAPGNPPQYPYGPTEWTPPPVWTPPTGPVSFAAQGAPSRRRRRVLRTAIVAVPALVVVAGASSLITLVVAGDHNSASGGAAKGSAAPASAQHATVGTVATQSGSSWVVKTPTGKSVTVHLGASTTFGTKAHPSSASAFHTGSTVKVVGTVKGKTVDAARVVSVTRSTSGPAT